MHRDIKCGSYLVDRGDLLDKQCNVVLTDFGTAVKARPTDRLTERVGRKPIGRPKSMTGIIPPQLTFSPWA